MRKLLIVNSVDRGGGAERVARALLDGFEELGTETWMAVGTRRTGHPRVVALTDTEAGAARLPSTRSRRMAREARRTAARLAGLEDYDHPASHAVLDVTGDPEPDVLLCGNLHGDYFDLRLLESLSQRVPVVLRLADSWLFTGHCASPAGCPRWEIGCGQCPDLTIPPAVERDATAANWRRKRSIFSGTRLFVVAPSQWQLDRARRSLLGPAIAEGRVVPNGVDLSVFRPDGPLADREAMGVPARAALLLFVCNGGAANPYKDLATVRAAMRRLGDRPVELAVVGRQAPLERLSRRVRIRHLPYLRSPDELAGLYRAADLYVHAAREETFCLTAAEALACGTPVVAAGAGGLAEVVDHGGTGLLSGPGDEEGVAASLVRLIDDRRERERMGAAAAAAARERFDERRMVREMHAFCADAAGAFATA